MSKPEDIPQDVWDAAEACFPGNAWNPLERVARAIMAAKAEEREACVSVVFGAYARTNEKCWKIIRAIRKRGEG